MDVESQADQQRLPIVVALQWGHVLLDVESRMPNEQPQRPQPLQWGHVLLDVERAEARPGRVDWS